MPNIEVGQTFTRTRRAVRDGQRCTARITATVMELIPNMRDIWQNEYVGPGVRLKLVDEMYGESYHTMRVGQFATAWTS